MDNAFNYVKANGILEESIYRYSGTYNICDYMKVWTHRKENISYYRDVLQSDYNLSQAISQQPVSVAIYAPPIQLYTGGVFDNFDECEGQLDHGVLAVGYTSEWFKVKNSWGKNWGENGYIRFKRRRDGAGMCGIT